MHHALEIEEILTNIFRYSIKVDLSSLARTCRTFKEPVLDTLWREVEGLTPLARCLPEASQQLSTDKFSFHRPLTPTEWDVLRKYTHRIQSIYSSFLELDAKSLRILSNPPTTESLFPNLRQLSCKYHAAMLLLHFPLPSLISVDFSTDRMHLDISSLDDFLQAFPQLCLNVRWAYFRDLTGYPPSRKAVSDCICGWSSLEIVCSHIPFDAVAIVHLSRMDKLFWLDLALDVTLPCFDSPPVFFNLKYLWLKSRSWSPVFQFLSRVQLPVVTNITAIVTQCPSRSELSYFFASAQISGASSIKDLQVVYSWDHNAHRSELLGLEDLRLCMGFSELCRIDLDLQWNISLTDSDLHTLASAWPRLERLSINPLWGWNTRSGITPNGLLLLLQTCPLLHRIALAMDTRGYVAFVPSPESLGPTLPRPFTIDVIDSIIKEKSISSVATFLAHVASLPGFRLCSGQYVKIGERPRWNVYERRWREVYEQAQDMINCRSHKTA